MVFAVHAYLCILYVCMYLDMYVHIYVDMYI